MTFEGVSCFPAKRAMQILIQMSMSKPERVKVSDTHRPRHGWLLDFFFRLHSMPFPDKRHPTVLLPYQGEFHNTEKASDKELPASDAFSAKKKNGQSALGFRRLSQSFMAFIFLRRARCNALHTSAESFLNPHFSRYSSVLIPWVAK